MTTYPVDVLASGAVLLGNDIACDGFHRDFKARVQTHVHTDHMDEFASSKGCQDILMSRATRLLLEAEYDADLPIRSNLRVLEMDAPFLVGTSAVSLLPSLHMLGAVQVCVELSKGSRVGYSGDFQWPLDEVIKVDALVVDSTYGSPRRRREYSQATAEQRFLELVTAKIKHGPVHMKAHRGTLQRALQVLAGELDCPIVGGVALCAEVEVYRQCGYGIGDILRVGTREARDAITTRRHIRVYGRGDSLPTEPGGGTTIVLSAFSASSSDPVIEYSGSSYQVALSNHADFNGTLEYIQATGAKYVVTDNARGGHAVELAHEISARLSIAARPSSNEASAEWGV